jgi:hypothetical protein
MPEERRLESLLSSGTTSPSSRFLNHQHQLQRCLSGVPVISLSHIHATEAQALIKPECRDIRLPHLKKYRPRSRFARQTKELRKKLPRDPLPPQLSRNSDAQQMKLISDEIRQRVRR